jgi:hypothetical protein
MPSSGTYYFQPSLGELVLYAFNAIGVRPTSLAQEHFQSARMATNLMLARWANQGVNLWKVELVTVPLVKGQKQYPVDPKVIMVLDAFVTTFNGSSPPGTNRVILPVSRTEYSSYPNPDQQGFTTVFWFDRLIAPILNLWPVPDGYSAQLLNYYAVTQVQDANYNSAQTVDIPYRWLEAFADGLAYRLAKIWAPPVAAALKGVADESYQIAALQDVENAATYISPMLSGYYRN